MIVVTGANGQLGRLVIEELLKSVPASGVVAAVRSPAKAQDLAARGVQVRQADYDRPQTLATAFRGADKVLLISSSEIGRRVPQHRAVVDAARAAGVGLLAYTSVLRADVSALPVAGEHRETEVLLKACGLPHVLLRHGWYTENCLMSLPAVLQHGALIGAAEDGRIAAASRDDFAAAAAAVLVADGQADEVYELAGDSSFTLAELAAEIGRQVGRPIPYHNLPEDDYRGALMGAGLPEPVATMVAQSDTAAVEGAMFDDGRQLSRLIGRPTTPMATTLAAALAAAH
ncbi:NAD(P)H-binding protein [Variovorax sp. LjRoot130]|uniref:NAD(P)H-binding protein n=1 Tax=Variovorax sp. LjRoot130 TaxID=3342261 RepID=UPI003ED03AA4